MRACLALLSVLALLPFLSGCAFSSYGVGSAESESGMVTYGPEGSAPSDPEATLRGVIPAIEAYYADNGTYTGMTPRLLRERYDYGLGDVRVTVASGGDSYCVETPSGAPSAHYDGPRGPVAAGPC